MHFFSTNFLSQSKCVILFLLQHCCTLTLSLCSIKNFYMSGAFFNAFFSKLNEETSGNRQTFFNKSTRLGLKEDNVNHGPLSPSVPAILFTIMTKWGTLHVISNVPDFNPASMAYCKICKGF